MQQRVATARLLPCCLSRRLAQTLAVEGLRPRAARGLSRVLTCAAGTGRFRRASALQARTVGIAQPRMRALGDRIPLLGERVASHASRVRGESRTHLAAVGYAVAPVRSSLKGRHRPHQPGRQPAHPEKEIAIGKKWTTQRGRSAGIRPGERDRQSRAADRKPGDPRYPLPCFTTKRESTRFAGNHCRRRELRNVITASSSAFRGRSFGK